MPRGGHFAALEQPNLLVNDIIKFGKKIRKEVNAKKIKNNSN